MRNICRVDGCPRFVTSQRLCGAHLARLTRKGDVLPDRPIGTRTERLAWIAAVAAEDGEGCRDWPWLNREAGYAQTTSGKVIHLVLEASGRPRPAAPGDMALHSCDRPICCAPWHLRWGTAAENAADAAERGQQARGSRNGSAKLTEQAVADIRLRVRSGERQKDLAQEYGVSAATVCEAVSGKLWAHVVEVVR